MLPLKQFSVGPTDDGPFASFQEDYQMLPLSTPLFSRRLMVCFKLLNTSGLLKLKPVVMVALPVSMFAWSLPFSQACQGQRFSKMGIEY